MKSFKYASEKIQPLRKDLHAKRDKMCVPANALANYLEEGDLKLMHTLHNQLYPLQGLTKKIFRDQNLK